MRINMKKLALTVSVMVLATAANAAVEGKHFTGFYLGGQIGYGSGQSEWSSKSVVAAAPDDFKSDLGTRGVLGGLHVGFGKEFNNRLYLGLEAFGNLSKTEGKSRTTVGNESKRLSAKRKHEFGAAIRPGFVCGNALLYVKAGISSAKWQYKSHLNSDVAANATHGSTHKHRLGFVPGVGVSFLASEHIVVGVEATHTMYKKQHHHVRLVADGTRQEKGRIKSHVTDFTGRVSYKW